MRVQLILGFVLGAMLIAGVGVSSSKAQEPDPALASSGLDTTPRIVPPSQPTWLAKVNSAVNDTTDLVLTAEETVALVAAYSTALRQRPGDIALSDTTCYVLAMDGTVLLSTALTPGE